MFEAERR
jgi:hypothetical protein